MSVSVFSSIRISPLVIDRGEKKQYPVDTLVADKLVELLETSGHPVRQCQSSDDWFVYANLDWIKFDRRELEVFIGQICHSKNIMEMGYVWDAAKKKHTPDPLNVQRVILSGKQIKDVVSRMETHHHVAIKGLTQDRIACAWTRFGSELISMDRQGTIQRKPVTADMDHLLSFDFDFNWTVEDRTSDEMDRIKGFLNDLVSPAIDDDATAEEIELADALRMSRLRALKHWIGAMAVRHRLPWAMGLIGPAGRGKGTLLNALQSVIPSYARTPYELHGVDDETRVAHLATSAVNICLENSWARVDATATARLKSIILGESVAGRHLYGRRFEVRPNVAFAFSANNEPTFVTDDDAIFERFLFIDCGANIGESFRANGKGDPGLGAWIEENIKYLILDSIRSYQADLVEGYNPFRDPNMKKRRAESAQASRSEMLFVDQEMIKDPEAVTLVKHALQAYNAWMGDAHKGQQLSQAKFAATLRGFGVRAEKSGKKVYRNELVIYGYKLNSAFSVNPSLKGEF